MRRILMRALGPTGLRSLLGGGLTMRLTVCTTLVCLTSLPQVGRPQEPSLGRSPSASVSTPAGDGTISHSAAINDEENRHSGEKMELHFDPATQSVTIRMWLHGPGGTFIPNIRPEDFVVYENGVRQPDPVVELERLPITAGILLEYGGRHSAVNAALGDAISSAMREFQQEFSQSDKIAFWRYSGRIEELSGFAESREQLLRSLIALGTPPLSETNLYDALIDAVGRLGSVSGRKALVLVSSGIDTFSNHNLADALEVIRRAALPVYVINLDPLLEQDPSITTDFATHAPVNWTRATQQLREIAAVSGGHMYSPRSSYGWSSTLDNLIESLRARYVVTYHSTTTAAASVPRNVRIEIRDPKTGAPLRGLSADGQVTRERIEAEGRYFPESASEEQPSAATGISAAGPGTRS